MSGPSHRDYFRAARDLRNALKQNREDSEFGRIVYLVDTNIAVTFLTGRQRGQISSVRSLMSRDAVDLSERLTYQYIFSGGLPGMAVGDTVLISQPHWDELIKVIRRTANDIETDLKALPRLTDEQRDELRAVRDQPDQLMERATDIGVDRIIGQFKAATRYRKRVTAILSGPARRVTPLDESDLWKRIDGCVSNNDFREWSELITTAKPGDEKDDTDNIEADAKTLAAIEALYRESENAIGESASVRFVFITSDTAILKAYDERRLELAQLGIPDFIRHPLVYHPLLNFSSMHRASTSFEKVGDDVKRVFLDVEGAVEALFPQHEEIVGGEGADLKWARHWNLRDNIDRWSNAAERIAIANVGMFGKDEELEASDEEIASYFDSDDLALAVFKTVHRTITGIEEDHARHMATQSFQRLVEMLQDGGIGRERRAPLSFPPALDILQRTRRRDNALFRKIQTLDDLLDHLSTPEGASSPVAQRINDALREDWQEPSIQFLAAVIYMVMGSWDLAISCAQICIRTATKRDANSEIAREARYCKAVCLRMQLRSEREILIARDELNANLAYRRRDALILERDSIERATLILSACIVQMVEQFSLVASSRRRRRLKPLVPEDDVRSAFDNQVQELDASLDVLASNYMGTAEIPPLVAAIAGQAAINRLGAELFRHFFEEEISEHPPRLAEVFHRVDDIFGEIRGKYILPLMGRIYVGIASVELELGGDPQAVIDEIDHRRQITKLARGDDHEYDYLRSQMASRASAESRAA